MDKIDKFADYLSENRDDAAALMESLSLIRDSTVKKVLKKHAKQNYAADRPLPWSKILHDIYILMVKREESRKDTERYLEERRKSGKKMGFLDRWLETSIDMD